MTILSVKSAAALALSASIGALPCAPAAAAPDASALAAKYSCQACHAADKKVVGPSYKEVAAKYAGDAGALAKLDAKVKNGGSGVWGAMAMPPSSVPDADRKALVEWILSTK